MARPLASSGVRIAILTDYYYPQLGGITEHVHGQATNLSARGHEVTVVTGHLFRPPAVADGDAAPAARDEPFEVLRMGQALRMYGNASQTLHTVDFRHDRQDEEAVPRAPLRRDPHACAVQPGLRDARAVRRARRRRSRSGRSTPCSRRGRCSTSSAARCARRSGGWTARSSSPRRASARSCRYFPYDYTVIPNGIDERHFTPDADPIEHLRDGRMNILFLGRFDPRNGLGTMIDAFVRVRREWGPEVRLVIVGDGPLKSYYQKRVPDDMEGDVHWAGRVDWERPRYYTSADVHCTPCNRASFGMVLLEAMSCGRADRREPHLRIPAPDGARQARADDPPGGRRRRGFAEALLYLLDRPAERARMGREGRRTAVTQYAWPRSPRNSRTTIVELMRGRR